MWKIISEFRYFFIFIILILKKNPLNLSLILDIFFTGSQVYAKDSYILQGGGSQGQQEDPT